MTRRRRGAALVLIAWLALGGVGCDLPRDPAHTRERVLAKGVLRVGVSEAPPWTRRAADDAAEGPEAELVAALAGRLGVVVEWRWGSLEGHLRQLMGHRLDLVAGGLTATSPWQARVGLSRPWNPGADPEYVLAVPPGENGWLVAVDHVIRERTK